MDPQQRVDAYKRAVEEYAAKNGISFEQALEEIEGETMPLDTLKVAPRTWIGPMHIHLPSKKDSTK